VSKAIEGFSLDVDRVFWLVRICLLLFSDFSLCKPKKCFFIRF
jgi:hypothetical protein